MKCREINELLSGYIDGVLDERERSLVEEHLRTCRLCAEDLVHLKASLKSLSSLEKADPPADFLKMVHARLEHRFSWKKVLNKLFVPARVKIPLEAVAVAATAVLVVFILISSPSQKPAPLHPGNLAGRPMEEEAFLSREMKVTEPATFLGARPAAVAGRPMEKKAMFAEEMGMAEPSTYMEVRSAAYERGEEKTVKLALLIEPEVDYADGSNRLSASVHQEKLKGLSELEMPDTEKKDEVRKSSALAQVKELISGEGGKIISVEEEAGSPQMITAELPFDRYESFLNKLNKLGNLQQTGAGPVRKDNRPVRLRIKLIPR